MEPTTKTHWKKLHNPDFLGAYSLMNAEGQYVDLICRFSKIYTKDVKGEDGKDAECIVAEIKGNKPMILNATNCKTLTKLFNSPAVEDWADKPITLTVKKIKAFGDNVDALRVATTLPTPPKLPDLTPDHPKWNDARTAILAKNTTLEAIRAKFTLTTDNENLLTKPNETV